MAEIKKKKKLAANHHLPYRIEDYRLVFPVSVPSLFFILIDALRISILFGIRFAICIQHV